MKLIKIYQSMDDEKLQLLMMQCIYELTQIN